MHYRIYFDETCKNDNYLLYGGGIFNSKIAEEIEAKIQAAKIELQIPVDEEIKWVKTNKFKLELHKKCVDILFEYLKDKNVVFIILGTNQKCQYYRSFSKSNSPTAALGKLIFNLLEQGVFADYGHKDDIFKVEDTFNLYVDEDGYIERKKLLRTAYAINTKYSQKYNGKKDEHLFLKDLQIVDSKNHILMQLSDLIIGSIGAIVNQKSRAGTPKGELTDYVMRKLKSLGLYQSVEELRRGSTPWKYKTFSYRIFKLCKSRSPKNKLGYSKNCLIEGKVYACP